MAHEELDEFTQDMIDSADAFVEYGSTRFSGLDYSVESLKVVDEALAEVADHYEDMDEDTRENWIATIGAYVFEVARRKYGGKYFWYKEMNQPILVTGLPEFEVSIVAFDKVRGRIENGPADNIPFYFKGYVERVENKQSGLVV